MKYFTVLLAQLFVFSLWANFKQDPVSYKRQDSEHIKEVMTSWDKTKGEYLYESMAAIVMKGKQPERPSGVNQTPYELLQTMDKQRVGRLDRIAGNALENERKSSRRNSYYWEEWRRYLNSTQCKMNRDGKSSGDPHMRTFDGESYDFQNAGDYLLTASDDNSFMVQTQQLRSTPSIAMNGGLALNVNGDLITFSSVKKGSGEKMMQINNQDVQNEKSNFVLPQGGIIEYDNGKYYVKWPTGEQLHIYFQRSYKEDLIFDLFVYVPACNQNYYGLLGNNDGEKNDIVAYDPETDEEYTREKASKRKEDVFGSNRNNPEILEEVSNELYFISREFGGMHQLDSTNSLLRNQMTNISDSIRYPRKSNSLAQLTDEEIEEGLKKAREAGVKEEDLFEAVYDYGHLGFEPIAFNDNYQSPKEIVRTKEPVLNKTGDGLKNDKGNSNNKKTPRIRVSPSIFMGTGVRVSPPRTNRPHTRTNRRDTGDSKNTSTNSRRTEENGSSKPSRTTRSSGRR